MAVAQRQASHKFESCIVHHDLQSSAVAGFFFLLNPRRTCDLRLSLRSKRIRCRMAVAQRQASRKFESCIVHHNLQSSAVAGFFFLLNPRRTCDLRLSLRSKRIRCRMAVAQRQASRKFESCIVHHDLQSSVVAGFFFIYQCFAPFCCHSNFSSIIHFSA